MNTHKTSQVELARSGMGINVVARRQMPSGHGDPQRCCDITQRRKEPREDLRKAAQARHSRCKGPGAEARSVSKKTCKLMSALQKTEFSMVTDYPTRDSPAQTASQNPRGSGPSHLYPGWSSMAEGSTLAHPCLIPSSAHPHKPKYVFTLTKH